MFRIEYLKLSNHPQLGALELFLSDIKEINNIDKPYTSVIIGPNGTGKSFILRTISDIFTQFNIFQTSGVKSINLPFYFHLRYKLDDAVYEINCNSAILKGKREQRNYVFYRNRPIDLKIQTLPVKDDNSKYEIKFNELKFPNHVIVNSVMLNDRFLFKNSKPEDFYQYLGVRTTSSTASTKSAVKGVINKLFSESISNENFLINLKELLSFLEFEDKFEVEYNTKLNKLFFTKVLTVKDFKQYYEFWWDKEFSFSNRSKNNPIWSKPFYDKYYKDDDAKIKEIVDFLNEISRENKLEHKDNSRAKFLRVDFYGSKFDKKDFWKIIDLEKLDIINVNGIKLKKNNSNMDISNISSGEFHLLISLIGIFSKIKENSLVMIDEPEISLHPNWQMQYITFLKKVFSKNTSCQFIITSHSHFIVSDLEGESSSVTAIKRNDENKLKSKLITSDTFGWSAEDILYNVFNAYSTRNKFIATDIAKILNELSKGDKNKSNYVSKEQLDKLIELDKNLKDNDPLKTVVKSILKKIL